MGSIDFRWSGGLSGGGFTQTREGKAMIGRNTQILAFAILTGFVGISCQPAFAVVYDDGGVHNLDQNIFPEILYVGGTTTVNLLPGFVSDSPYFYDQAIVNLSTNTSAGLDSLLLGDNATMNILDGGTLEVYRVYLDGTPTINTYDGSSGSIEMQEGFTASGFLNVYGGDILRVSLSSFTSGHQTGGQVDLLELYDNSYYRLDGGILDGPVYVGESAVLDIHGGTHEIGWLSEILGTVNMFGGSLPYYSSSGTGVFNLFGGDLGQVVYTRGSTTGNIWGGSFQNLNADGDSILNVYGQNLSLTEYEFPDPTAKYYYLNGTLSDGTILNDVGVITAESGQVFLYNAVPEPTSFIMWAGLGVMGLVAARRRRRKR